eukprot:8604674-Pyramimonas_sp.AAC.3
MRDGACRLARGAAGAAGAIPRRGAACVPLTRAWCCRCCSRTRCSMCAAFCECSPSARWGRTHCWWGWGAAAGRASPDSQPSWWTAPLSSRRCRTHPLSKCWGPQGSA